MSLTIKENLQYNAFVKFAQSAYAKGDNEAIATASLDDSRKIVAAGNSDMVRGIFHWRRSDDAERVNNRTRTLFLDAVIDMFGGRENIPEDVVTALELHNYNQGKPLTARRIIAVNNAIAKELKRSSSAAVANAANDSLEDAAAPQNQNGPRLSAKDVAEKLDSLLIRAAIKSTTLVNEETISAVARKAGLDDAKCSHFETLVKRTLTSFARLADYTGREIGSAITAENGGIVWDKEDPVASAIRLALDDQAALSDELHDLLKHPEISDGDFDSICELALQCDRRRSEIMTLALELADAVEQAARGDNKAVDERLDTKLLGLLPRQALSMHGTAADLALIQKNLNPLIARLDGFTQRPPEAIRPEEYEGYLRELHTAANALKRAGRDGIPDGSGGRTIPDSKLLDAASSILKEVEVKIADIRREVVKNSAERHIDSVLGKINQVRAVSTERAIEKIKEDGATKLAAAARLKHTVLALAKRYLENPSNAIASQMRAAADGLAAFDLNELTSEIEELAKLQKYASRPRSYWGEVFREMRTCNGVRSQVEHLIAIMKSAEGTMSPEKFLTTKSAKAVFDGEMPFTTLVESRIRGIDDSDVDPAIDDQNVEDVKKLGSGQVNTAFTIVMKDGSKHVFKPEAPGRQSMESLALSMDYKPQTQVAHLNIATGKAAVHLGFEDIMPKTTTGSIRNQYGIIMEMVPGTPVTDFRAPGAKLPPNCLSAADVRRLDDARYGKVVGRIIRQTNRLEWFDMLTGQGDRHQDNYMIEVKDDLTVTVKAIDNDMCFPAYRTGLRTMVLGGKRAATFDECCEQLVNVYPEEYETGNLDQDGNMIVTHPRAEVRRLIQSDPGIRRRPDGRIEINPAKFQLAGLHWAVRVATGSDCDVLPEYIDEDVYLHLQNLRPGTPARRIYEADLEKYLPADAVASAMRRLDEAIDLAERLKQENKVISAADFEKRDVQRRILAKELQMPNPIVPIAGYDIKTSTDPVAEKIISETRFQVKGDFMGDLYGYVTKKGWFK